MRRWGSGAAAQPIAGGSPEARARGDARAVQRRADDAARVSRAFATRIEALQRGRLQRVRVAQQANRRAGSRLRRDQHGVGKQKAGQPRAHAPQARAQRLGEKVGQHLRQVAGREPGPIAGRADRGAGAAVEEIREPLRRRAEAAAAGAEGGLLHPPLQLDARQRPRRRGAEVGAGDGDDQARVRERRIAARQAHAVDHDAVGLGRRGDDPAARGTCRSCRRRDRNRRSSARRTRAAAWDGRRRRRTGSRRSGAAGARCARRSRSPCVRGRCRPRRPTCRPAAPSDRRPARRRRRAARRRPRGGPRARGRPRRATRRRSLRNDSRRPAEPGGRAAPAARAEAGSTRRADAPPRRCRRARRSAPDRRSRRRCRPCPSRACRACRPNTSPPRPRRSSSSSLARAGRA